MKKLTLSITALLLAVMLCACGGAGTGGDKDNALKLEGNLVKLTSTEDFNKGTLESALVDETVGNGAVKLADGATEGVFLSAEYSITDFEEMVASWNATLEGNCSVEIQARAYIVAHNDFEERGDWSGWLTWGEYGPTVKRGGLSNNDGDIHGGNGWVFMNQDIFSVRGVHGATKVQFKAILRRESASNASPVLRQINATIRNSNAGREIEATYAETPFDGTLPNSVYNVAPAYAQGIRHPDIGGSICSPTTMSMLLNSRNPQLDLLPEEAALNIYDFGNGIFGNWAYAASFGGLYGYESYFQYGSLDILMQELAKGNTVGLSVKYSNDKSSSYPYLEGSYGSTGGHLISIIGYEYEAGHEGDLKHLYFISGDSYSFSDATSFHRYKWTQLDKAWGEKRSMYVMPSQTPEVAGIRGVQRVEATLELVGTDTYTLKVNGEAFDLTKFNNNMLGASGRGVIAYTVEGKKVDVKTDLKDSSSSINYSNALQVTANNIFRYDIFSLDGSNLKVNASSLLKAAQIPEGETPAITFYFMANNGVMYIAQLPSA